MFICFCFILKPSCCLLVLLLAWQPSLCSPFLPSALPLVFGLPTAFPVLCASTLGPVDPACRHSGCSHPELRPSLQDLPPTPWSLFLRTALAGILACKNTHSPPLPCHPFVQSPSPWLGGWPERRWQSLYPSTASVPGEPLHLQPMSLNLLPFDHSWPLSEGTFPRGSTQS